MKVLQINAVYGYGSTGKIVQDIEKLCFINDIDCYVASPDKNVLTTKNSYVIGNVFDHKLHALLCRINGKQAYYSYISTKQLLKYIETIEPDVVHLHNLHSNYIHLNILLKYLANNDIRTIITLHDCWFYTGGCFHYTAAKCNKWLKQCGNCPKKRRGTPAFLLDKSRQILEDRKKYFCKIPRLTVTGVSNWISNEANRTFLNKYPIYTIPNGVDLDVFKPTVSDIRKSLGLDGKYIFLGPAGKWLSAENKDALHFFADNMTRNEVLLLFGSNNVKDLPDNIIQYGYTFDKTELAALYSTADVFVNCTREESLSMINIEAQACGTPVITYGGTGVQETVDGQCGYVVQTGDIKHLLSIARNMKKSDISTQCRQWIYHNYNLQNNYDKYIRLYKQIDII